MDAMDVDKVGDNECISLASSEADDMMELEEDESAAVMVAGIQSTTEILNDADYEAESKDSMQEALDEFLKDGSIDPSRFGPQRRQYFRHHLNGVSVGLAPKQVRIQQYVGWDEYPDAWHPVEINKKQAHFVSDLFTKCRIQDVRLGKEYETDDFTLIDTLRTIKTIERLGMYNWRSQDFSNWMTLFSDLNIKELVFLESANEMQGPMLPFENQLCGGNVASLERLFDLRREAVFDFGRLAKVLQPAQNLKQITISTQQMRWGSNASFAQFISAMLDNHPQLEEASFIEDSEEEDVQYASGGMEELAAAVAKHQNIRKINLPFADEDTLFFPSIIDAWASKDYVTDALHLHTWDNVSYSQRAEMDNSDYDATLHLQGDIDLSDSYLRTLCDRCLMSVSSLGSKLAEFQVNFSRGNGPSQQAVTSFFSSDGVSVSCLNLSELNSNDLIQWSNSLEDYTHLEKLDMNLVSSAFAGSFCPKSRLKHLAIHILHDKDNKGLGCPFISVLLDEQPTLESVNLLVSQYPMDYLPILHSLRDHPSLTTLAVCGDIFLEHNVLGLLFQIVLGGDNCILSELHLPGIGDCDSWELLAENLHHAKYLETLSLQLPRYPGSLDEPLHERQLQRSQVIKMFVDGLCNNYSIVDVESTCSELVDACKALLARNKLLSTRKMIPPSLLPLGLHKTAQIPGYNANVLYTFLQRKDISHLA